MQSHCVLVTLWFLPHFVITANPLSIFWTPRLSSVISSCDVPPWRSSVSSADCPPPDDLLERILTWFSPQSFACFYESDSEFVIFTTECYNNCIYRLCSTRQSAVMASMTDSWKPIKTKMLHGNPGNGAIERSAQVQEMKNVFSSMKIPVGQVKLKHNVKITM